MESAWVFDRWCGFQVIDLTVAWIVSRVGPTIRRGHRLVPYCATACGLVYIPTLLAVVLGCLRFIKFCWVGNHINTIMKPTNSLQGQPNPRKFRLKVAVGPLFPTANILSWVGIDFM